MKQCMKWLFVVVCMFSGLHATPLPTLEKKMLVDSEEPFDRRIYAYDMAIDLNGNVHIVYQKPTTGDSASVYYLQRKNGVWMAPKIVTTHALHLSISTRIAVDAAGNVFVSYIKDNHSLNYCKITNNTVGQEIYVRPGGWHTRMQLDSRGFPIFIREGEVWQSNPTISKLVLVSTTNGYEWNEQYLDLPNVNKFRIGEFVYKNGVYHITYGDSAVTKATVAQPNGDGVFHNLHYASSSDGVNWSHSIIDNTASLYEWEFWTSLIVDGSTPVVGWYKYAEYNGEYNTGTSGRIAVKSGNGWNVKNITPASYAATREGMGIGLVAIGSGEYLGGWDFSPDNTYDDNFRGIDGNMALVRFRSDGTILDKWQLDEFSAEGEVLLRHANGKIYILVLGNFRDAKLYFYELDGDVVGGLPVAKESSFPYIIPIKENNQTKSIAFYL